MNSNRWKSVPWVLGISLMVVSVIAWNRLGHSPVQGQTETPKAEPNDKPALVIGLILLGTVDSAPSSIARVDAPATPMGLMVKEILVKDGQEVQIGDALIQFDDTIYRERLLQAQAELKNAQWDADNAETLKKDQVNKVEKQQLAVKEAETTLKYAQSTLAIATDTMERYLATAKDTDGVLLTEAAKERRRREDPDLLKAQAAVEFAELSVKNAALDLKRLGLAPIESTIQQARAKVERLNATVKEMEALLSDCRVTAKVGGVVEQIQATPGMTYGPATRSPTMYIVPSGERIVRAEVEAEFATKVGERVGQTVTITDQHTFDHAYEGVVERLSTSFLPKRNSNDVLNVNPTRVLECIIRIKDANPPNHPMLLVGQPVRVIFSK